MTFKISEDNYWITTADTVVYYITTDNKVIFKGKAYKSPDDTEIKINVTKLCCDWISNTLTDFRNTTDILQNQLDAYKEFKLYEYVEGQPVLRDTFHILYNWDNDMVWSGQSCTLSNPINGKMDNRMKLFYSVYRATTGETICYDIDFNVILDISPSFIEAHHSGGTFTIRINSNVDYQLESNFWITLSQHSGTTGTTVITATITENGYEERDGYIRARYGNYMSVSNVHQSAKYAPIPAGNQIYYTTTNNVALPNYNVNTWSGTSKEHIRVESNTYNDGLGILTFSGNIGYVPKSAFYDYTYNTLKTIIFPEGVLEFGDNAITNFTGRGTSVIYYNIPSTVIKIGMNAFSYTKMSVVKIPDSVATLYSWGWYYTDTEEVYIGRGLNTISGDTTSKNPFIFSRYLRNIYVDTGNTTFSSGANNDYLYNKNTKTLHTMGINTGVMPSDVRYTVGSRLFYDNQATAITIPSTFIQDYGISNFVSQNVQEIFAYPTTAPTLGQYAFGNNGNYIKSNGILHIPIGSDYSSWMNDRGTSIGLGYLGWTVVNDL